MPLPHLPPGLRHWARENRFLLVFAVLASVMGTSVGTARVATSLYALSLGAGTAQVGVIVAGQMTGSLLMSVPVGVLVDQVGPRRLFLLGSVMAGLAYAAVPLLPSPAFLMGCLTAVGLFMPLRFVSLNTVFFAQIRQLGEHKAGWYRGTHMTGMHLVGPGLAVALVGWAGHAGTWWLIAGSFAFTVLLSPIVFGRYSPARSRAARGGWRALRHDLGAVWRDAELREINGIDFSTQATTAFHTTFVVVLALQVFHLPAGTAAAFVTVHGAVFIALLFLGGGLVRRLGARGACVAGFGVAALALAAIACAPSAAWLWPAAVPLGAALGLLQTVTLSRIAGVGARLGQGKVSGVNAFVGPSGALVGTAVGGLVGDHAGLQNTYLLFVPVYAFLAVRALRAPVRPVASSTLSTPS